LRYCSKTSPARNLAGAKKKKCAHSKMNFALDIDGDIVATIFCYCSKTTDM
jgi:hypothetical protein